MKEAIPEYHQEQFMHERNILEDQSVEVLIDYRATLLEHMSRIENNIHLINDVLGGMGYEEPEL